MPAVPQDHPYLLGDLRERVVRAARVVDDQLPGVLVLLGVQDREDEVFQLGLERLDAEALGEGDQHVAGHLGDARLFLRAHHAEGPHVVQPVGEFDRHHADVVAGRDQHLAEGLRFGGGAVVDLLQLGDAVDQIADLVAELLADLIQRHFRVLDGVVEQGGGQRRGLGAQLGEDQGHGQRVRDVGLAALAHLAAVRGLREHPRPAQGFQFGVGVVGAVRLRHVPDRVRQPVARGGSQQCGPAQSPQVDPRTSLPAVRWGHSRFERGRALRGGRCGAWRRGIRRLRTHGHLRLRKTGGRVPQGVLGSGDGVGPPSGPVLDATEPTTPG